MNHCKLVVWVFFSCLPHRVPLRGLAPKATGCSRDPCPNVSGVWIRPSCSFYFSYTYFSYDIVFVTVTLQERFQTAHHQVLPSSSRSAEADLEWAFVVRAWTWTSLPFSVPYSYPFIFPNSSACNCCNICPGSAPSARKGHGCDAPCCKPGSNPCALY